MDIKKKLWNIVDENQGTLLDICSTLIKTPSENPGGNVEDIVKVICGYFDDSHIDYEIVRPKEQCPNIIVTMGNDHGKTLLLNGHCDVVPVGDLSGWDFPPFSGEIKDGVMLGRGTSDMKAGLGGLIFAMKTIKDNNLKIKGKIVLHVVPDEETGGDNGTKWLYKNGYFKNGDACIIAEPTSYNNCEVGQKGSLWLHITSKGKPAHGSVGNYKGENAITKLMKLLMTLEELRTIEGKYDEKQLPVLCNSKRVAKEALKAEGIENVIDHLTVNIGTINGGTKTNMVPDYCEATVDMRVPIGVTLREVLDKFEAIIERLKLTGIDYTYTWNSEANYTDVDTDLVRSVVSNAETVWNRTVVPAYQWASSDARYYRMEGMPTIQYGPANTEGIHSYNENVDVEDIINSSKVYLGVMTDLLHLEFQE